MSTHAHARPCTTHALARSGDGCPQANPHPHPYPLPHPYPYPYPKPKPEPKPNSPSPSLSLAQAALAGETLEHALSRLEASGAALAPGFAAFAEACLVKGVTLHVLSRGWKPVISHFLRSAGLGHVQVRQRQQPARP